MSTRARFSIRWRAAVLGLLVSASLSGCWGKESPAPTPDIQAPEMFPLPDSIPARTEPEATPTPQEPQASPTPEDLVPEATSVELEVPPAQPALPSNSEQNQQRIQPVVQAPRRAPLTTQQRQVRRERRQAEKIRRKEERANRRRKSVTDRQN